MAHVQGMTYGDSTGTQSSIGAQVMPYYYERNAIVETAKERVFSQTANTKFMPKHKGKTIIREKIIPVLNDENINDQGIDATANHDEFEVTIIMTNPDGMKYYVVGQGKTGQALTAAKKAAFDKLKNLKVKEATTDYDTSKTALEGLNWTFEETDERSNFGNMMGSSKDIGVFEGKTPLLPETGGMVNRIGFTKKSFKASIQNYGFYFEYTRDAFNFENIEELYKLCSVEAIKAANEITEGQLQINLLNAAGIVAYGGDATSLKEVTGEQGATPSVLTYDLLKRVSRALTEKRCPFDTTIITGSRIVDSKLINRARYAYIGHELTTSIEKMKNFHGEPAFIPAFQYSSNSTLARGEYGSVDEFRFILVPEMKHWAGKGADVTNNDGYLETNGKYDVFPVLIVGDDSYNTIGFESDGVHGKFEILVKKPGLETATNLDPYGKKGFWSIQWWYGFMAYRPERIALMKVVAER